MSHMLDITHYLLEEDSMRGIAMAEDPPETLAKMRAGIYRNLYKRSHGASASGGENDQPYDAPYPTADSASGRELKPYVPPTELTENEALPYGNVVGAPLGF